MLEFSFIQEAIPDIFYLAAHTWGVELRCLCLLPLVLSLVVLVVVCIKLVHVAIMEERHRTLVLTLICFLGFLLCISGFRLFTGDFSSVATLYKLSLGIELIIFIGIWLLLFILFRPLSRALILYGGVGVLCGVVGCGLLFMYNSLLPTFTSLTAETLLLVSIGFIGIFIEHIQSRLVPITS
ncbi:MAG TPA: hypothetical protein VJH21_00765 [Candidatus Paceibacterota bacterium]